MKATVSFHPVRLGFFDETIQPLVAGRKVNPEGYLNDALRFRRHAHRARRYLLALEERLVASEPPRADPGAGLLQSFRARLQRLDHREDEFVGRLRNAVDPDLHLHGRPFLIAEGSAARVAERVEEYRTAPDGDAADDLALEQLAVLGPDIAKGIDPVDGLELSADLAYRADLLAKLKDLYDIAHAARRGETWGPGGRRRRPAREILIDELPYRAVWLHARAVPFWIARDVDGLETVCRAAGVPPPEFIVPPRRLFAEACEEFPDLKDALHVELQGPRDAAAFVAPAEIPELVEFLSASGSRIIQAASRAGEGPACTVLLRKIRECAAYAQRTGAGYLEASGIVPPDLDEDDDETEDRSS